MLRAAVLVAVLALFTSITFAAAAEASADDRATPCSSIEDCDFDQQCVQGTCHVGTVSLDNAARSTNKESALICNEDACRLGTNYIYNSDLALMATTYSPAFGPGLAGSWVDQWLIEGVAGVVIYPLRGAGGYGWKTNEVAIRAYWPDGGFSYTMDDLPVGHKVTLTWMMRDSQGTYVCAALSTYVLYVEVDNYPRQTFRVTPHAGKKRGSFEFRATSPTMKVRFSTEKDAYDGCGPFFTNVKATV
ncbi:hypothetical protein MY11210_008118 [Beauveria gryllotalpidicola]